MQFPRISVSQDLTSDTQNKTSTSGFLKKVKLKFKKKRNSGLNDVIEGFFSKKEEKVSLKVAQMNQMSVQLINNIAIHPYMFLKDSENVWGKN